MKLLRSMRARVTRRHGRSCPCRTCTVRTLEADGVISAETSRRLQPWRHRVHPGGTTPWNALMIMLFTFPVPVGLLLWGPDDETRYKPARNN